MERISMIYNGNLVFHYTSFDAALRICCSQQLKFGRFDKMNDIAEIKREIYHLISGDKFQKELNKYKSISLTLDFFECRGFWIDPLWGHYAQNGNGVCLAFNKEKLENALRKEFKSNAVMKPIVYENDYTSNHFFDNCGEHSVSKIVKNYREELFFKKSKDWEYEKEMRILTKSNKDNIFLPFDEDVLIAAILCLPKVDDYQTSDEFKILRALCPNLPILNYKVQIDGKVLLDEKGNRTCNIFGHDIAVDIPKTKTI